MAYTRFMECDFGTANASLATVGYRLYNADGTANGSRVTAGVAERPAASGIYVATVTFPAGFSGEIRWDTGTGSPIYASDTVNPGGAAEYLDGAVSAVSGGGSGGGLTAGETYSRQPYGITLSGVSGGRYIVNGQPVNAAGQSVA